MLFLNSVISDILASQTTSALADRVLQEFVCQNADVGSTVRAVDKEKRRHIPDLDLTWSPDMDLHVPPEVPGLTKRENPRTVPDTSLGALRPSVVRIIGKD